MRELNTIANPDAVCFSAAVCCRKRQLGDKWRNIKVEIEKNNLEDSQ